MFLNPNLNSNCSNLLDMRNLQEQVKKAFCFQKLFWPFILKITRSWHLENISKRCDFVRCNLTRHGTVKKSGRGNRNGRGHIVSQLIYSHQLFLKMTPSTPYTSKLSNGPPNILIMTHTSSPTPHPLTQTFKES